MNYSLSLLLRRGMGLWEMLRDKPGKAPHWKKQG